MKVRILLEKKLEMLEISYEILKIKKSMTKNKKEFMELQNELKSVREKKILIKKLLYSITWENWIEEKELKVTG